MPLVHPHITFDLRVLQKIVKIFPGYWNIGSSLGYISGSYKIWTPSFKKIWKSQVINIVSAVTSIFQSSKGISEGQLAAVLVPLLKSNNSNKSRKNIITNNITMLFLENISFHNRIRREEKKCKFDIIVQQYSPVDGVVAVQQFFFAFWICNRLLFILWMHIISYMPDVLSCAIFCMIIL